LFIFGLGYVGSALAFKLAKEGWEVHGTVTNPDKIEDYRQEGVNAMLFNEWILGNVADEEKEALVQATHILTSVPPASSTGKDPVLLAHAKALELACTEGNCRWIGYLSSTGVYGDAAGAWVTEDSPARPTTPKTAARRDAERAWQYLHERRALPVHVFRLAGIYGPTRSALDTLRKADGDMARCSPDDTTFISRVHVADILQALCASMGAPSPGRCLNVADDQPATRYEVLSFAARLLGAPVARPAAPSVTFDRWLDGGEAPRAPGAGAGGSGALGGPMKGPRGGGSKRVDNGRLREFLTERGLGLVHPDYRSGLRALAEEATAPFTPAQLELVVPPKPSRAAAAPTPRPADDNLGMGDLAPPGFAIQEDQQQRVQELEQKVERLESQVTSISDKMDFMISMLQQQQPQPLQNNYDNDKYYGG